MTSTRSQNLQKLDAQIIKITQSTRTALPLFIPIHDWLRLHLQWYYNWHINQFASTIHQIIFLLAVMIGGTMIVTIIGSGLIFGLFYVIK
ncbi:hypothetical protein HY065_00155 [Candidatus Berkelbacteria bacterium]|nr:hypothetical protein [Candidatus Berkelbacteria bacterium]